MSHNNAYEKYLSQSKKLSNYCNAHENILHEILKMELDESEKVQLLDLVGVEIGRVLKYIERLRLERKS